MKKRILVADDEPLNREIYRRYLENLGYEVKTVCCAEDALQEFQKEHFDLVLTDNQMEEMKGIELAAKIKGINPAMPVVLVSGTLPKDQPAWIDRMIAKPPMKDAFIRLAELIK